MSLHRPISLGGLEVSDFLVRTGDHRGGNSLPSDAVDPAEIVVTGPSRQAAIFMFTVGLDHLARCSAMIYDRSAGTMTLRCSGAPAA